MGAIEHFIVKFTLVCYSESFLDINSPKHFRNHIPLVPLGQGFSCTEVTNCYNCDLRGFISSNLSILFLPGNEI